jgi:hypothetical protein
MLVNRFPAKRLNSLEKPLPVAGQSTAVKVERGYRCEPAKAYGASIYIQCPRPAASGRAASAPKH